MRHYHSREQSDKRRLHLHKDEANDSKGHLSIMWSFCRGSPDDLSDDSTFFLAWLRFKHFSALKSKVIRLKRRAVNFKQGLLAHNCSAFKIYVRNRYWERKKKKKNITCYIQQTACYSWRALQSDVAWLPPESLYATRLFKATKG